MDFELTPEQRSLRGEIERTMVDMSQRERPVFVVGLGRSGTSLTRSLINDHGEIAIAPEIHFLDHWMPKFRRIDIAREFDSFWTSFILGKHFPRLRIESAGDSVRHLGERAPVMGAHLPDTAHATRRTLGPASLGREDSRLLPTYRTASGLVSWSLHRVLAARSTGRGCIPSGGRHRMGGSSILHTSRGAGWRAYGYLRSWSAEPRVQLFRYEDIVSAPRETLAELFRFLGSEYEPTLTKRHPMVLRENGSFAPGAAVEATHIDRWRERLSPRDVAAIEHICGRAMDNHGYERVSDGLGAKALMQLRLASARRDLVRAARVVNQPREVTYRISIRIRRRFENHSSAH